jgi:hypothetical protein
MAGGPNFYADDNIRRNLQFIDEKIGRSHQYTALPEIKRVSQTVDDDVNYPPI